MNHGVNQPVLSGEALVAAAVVNYPTNAERASARTQIAARLRQWLNGRHHARAANQAAHDEHVEAHWQKMAADHDESWRWRANGF